MFSMSSARAPSPASAVATSPEARSSRNASADTATATSTASPRRFSAKPSMRRAREPSPVVGEGSLPRSGKRAPSGLSLPAHLPEPRNFVRVGGEDQILGGDVEDGNRIERQHVGARRVAMGGVLHEPQISPHADRVEIADDRLELIAIAVAVEVDVEAAGIAGFGEQLLRLHRIIAIARRGLYGYR